MHHAMAQSAREPVITARKNIAPDASVNRHVCIYLPEGLNLNLLFQLSF